MGLPTLIVRLGKPTTDAPDRYPVELACAEEQKAPLASGHILVSALDEIASTLAQDEDLQAAGEALYAALSNAGIGLEWVRIRTKYELPDNTFPQGTALGLRTIFELPAKLHTLPWERLAAIDDLDRVRFFMRSANPCSRRLPNVTATPPQLGPDWSVRVLLIVAAKEEDEKIKWREEVAAVRARARELRHALDVDLLLRPTLATVRARLATSYDIIHFIGHGQAGKNAGDGRLLLDSQEKGVEEWGAEDIKTDLKCVPRLAFLNACETGATGGSGWHAAHAFVARGTPYVLAMTGDLPATIGVTVSKSFYADLANGSAPDVAAANMREAIRAEHGGINGSEWSVPCLFAHVLPAPVAMDSRRICASSLPFAQVTPMIDRFKERQQILNVLRAKSCAVVVVEGARLVGKTALVTYSLERLNLAKQSLSYVDVGHPRVANWLELIRLIRKGNQNDGPSALTPPPQAFHRFHHAIKHLLRGNMPPPFDNAAHDDDETIKLDLQSNMYPQSYREDAWAAFLEGFAPLDHVLALDTWDATQQSHDDLERFFLKPLAARKDAGLRVVVLTSDAGRLDISGAEVVRVEPFGPTFGPYAVEELYETMGLPRDEIEAFLDLVRKVAKRWDGSTIKNARGLAEKLKEL